MSGSSQRVSLRRSAARAFSLIEMLVVLAVIVIILAILLPAMATMRNSARKSATLTLQKDVGRGCDQFLMDQRRQPGYFGQADMGSTENAMNGFTQMQNVMLDLAGGISSQASENVAQGIIEVGPTTAKQVRVKIDEIGNPSLSSRGNIAKSYYRPDAKYFQVQNGGNQLAMPPTDQLFPMLVDAWGQPILAWVQDDVPAGSVPFAAEDSANRARFYWNTNAGVLNARGSGRNPQNQFDDSLIGGNANGTVTTFGVATVARAGSLLGLLANPAGGSTTSGAMTGMPTSPRGPIVLHSAGPNELFLGKLERGGKTAATESPSAPYLNFRANQDPITGGAFDDVVSSFGN